MSAIRNPILSLLAALFMALVLAACGAPEPTPTPTAVPTQPAPTESPVPTATLADVVLQARTQDVLLPGTLEIREGGAGTLTPAPAFSFTLLEFQRVGGSTNAVTSVTLTGDGAMIYDGIESQLTPERLEAVRAALEAVNFFGLQGAFTGAAAAGTYNYTLLVENPANSRTLRATQGFTPPELQTLFELIIALNQ